MGALIGGSALILMLTALALGFGHEPHPTEKTIPIVEAAACFFGFVLVVLSALFCGLFRRRIEQPILLATRRGAVFVAAVIVLLGGPLLWGFLHYAG